MHTKKLVFAFIAAGVLTIGLTPSFADAAPETVKAAAEPPAEPIISSAPAAQPASVIVPPISSRLGFKLKPMTAMTRATSPLKSNTVVAAPEIAVKVAAKTAPTTAVSKVAAPKIASPQTAPSGPSAADLKLLAQLDAELNATETKLDKANAQLTSGQKQLVSVAGLLQSEMLQGGPDSRGLHPFVRVAQRYAGTPYVWGGESARGFDCSGFIIRVMRDLGYKALPHSAAEQFRYGIPVAKANLQPGDLVFFANTYKPGISHVGIYLGRGRFIHAASTIKGTIVSSLSGSYAAKYAGARRLVRAKS